jgi:ribosomal-protein-alanine N-acetyltransferase
LADFSARVPLFETKRLYCYSLELSDYKDFESGQEPTWRNFTNPYRHLVEGPNPLTHRIPKVAKNPAFAEIGIVLGVLKEKLEIIGSAGFHNMPDENGMIEIGFGIVPEMQNQGLGTEILVGMWEMISKSPDVKILRYTVSPENAPSLHIIKKFGFKLVGEQMDPEDGLELIFEQTVSEFLTGWR